MSTHLLLNEKPLMVLPSLAKLLGINAAIAVQQIHWIIEIKHENHDDRTDHKGFTWCKYTLNQWQSKLCWMTTDGIHKMLTKLERDDVIISCKPEAKSKNQTKWYRVNYDGLIRLSTKSISDSVQNESLYSVQNESLYSVQNESLYSVQNDLYQKDLKDLEKDKILSFQNLISEQTENLSLELIPKDQDPTPPYPPAPPLRNYAEEMSDRFSNKSNRFAPKGLEQQGFSEWHLGGKRNNWHQDLIAVAKAHLKKHDKPFGDGDAINFINAICLKEDWAKFELFADEAKTLQQKPQQRSQQLLAELPELAAIAPPPDYLRNKFKKAS